MKYFKHIGLYFSSMAVGYSLLKIAEVNKACIGMFLFGNALYFMTTIWEEDS